MLNSLFRTNSKLSSFIIMVIILLGCDACGGGGGSTNSPNYELEDENELDYIDDYHASFFPKNDSFERTNNINFYYDYSSGVTLSAIQNETNKEIVKTLIYFIKPSNTRYFDVCDEIHQHTQGGEVNHYTNIDQSATIYGKPLSAVNAKIDKALEAIVSENDIGILITDGELYANGAFIDEPWASIHLNQWLTKGHSLHILYNPYIEQNNGKSFDKKIYCMLFVPKGSEEWYSELLASYAKFGLETSFKQLHYSTNTSDLARAEYPNSQTPGAAQAIENEFLATNEDGQNIFYKPENNNYEYIDLSQGEFNDDEMSGLIGLLRDGTNEQGKKQNFALLEKLFFRFESLDNYDVENPTIRVYNIYDDFNQFVKNSVAINKCTPTLKKDSTDESTALRSDGNYIIFEEVPTINGQEPYDTISKTMEDVTIDGEITFNKIFKGEFEYKQKEFNTKNRIKDFLILDEQAGKNQEENSDEYEIIIKFSDQLSSSTPGLSQKHENLIRIDVILEPENIKLDPVDMDALTWQRMDDQGSLDRSLYSAIDQTMENLKPNEVIYTYYIKLPPFFAN